MKQTFDAIAAFIVLALLVVGGVLALGALVGAFVLAFKAVS